MREVSEIESVRPCGSQVLVEVLNPEECYGTKLILHKQTKVETPQAIILAVGPAVKLADWGFDIGDRVLLSAQVTPVPNFNESKRNKVLLEPHCVKAVVVEKE